MSGHVLLELHEECSTVSIPDSVTCRLMDALQQSVDGPVRLLTDWGPGAVFGVSTVMAGSSTAAAVLEKQLRDQGETDDISHLLVHQSQTRMGSTQLVYTAVPIKTWRRYQQVVANHPQLVLMYDWVHTLMFWAKTQDLINGTLLVLHPEGLDVLVMEEGRVRALDRLTIFQDERDAWSRMGQCVVSLLRDLDVSDTGVNFAINQPAMVVVCSGAETFLTQFIGGLSPLVISKVWAQAPELVQIFPPIAPLRVQHLAWVALITSLPLRQAVNRPLDKAAVWADHWVPVVGVAAFGLSFIMAITASVMHYRTQLGFASISGDAQKTQKQWQTLNADVDQAEKLAIQQKEVREWVQQRVNSDKVPDMVMVMQRIKNSLPPGMLIDEIGLVVEKDTHLVTVIGHASLVEDALRSESALAQALQGDGFVLKKRDLLLREGQPKFRLSMTWSAT